jgi:hypothetical protein
MQFRYLLPTGVRPALMALLSLKLLNGFKKRCSEYPFGDDRDYALWKVRDKDGFEHTAEPDDYLIYDEDKGTITTCKSRIFKLVYDPVEVEA